jgi:hypothetical protein
MDECKTPPGDEPGDESQVGEPTVSQVDYETEFRELEQRRRQVEAEMASLLAHADVAGAYGSIGHRGIAGWCRALGRWSDAEVQQRTRVSRLLRFDERYASAVAAGEIGVAQAQLLARAHANPRCGERISEVMEILLHHARCLTYHDFRQVVDRWEKLADADGAHREEAAAHAGRRAVITQIGEQIHVEARGGLGQGAMMEEIFQRFVQAEFRADWEENRRLHGEDATVATLARTEPQRRFDALARIFARAAAAPVGAVTAEPLVNLVIDLHTYEQMVLGATSGEPPTDPRKRCSHSLSGIPVPASDVVAASLWGQIRRVVVDSAGVVVDMGRKSRLFTGPARTAAILQSRRCVVAGCTVSSYRCQVDHIKEWADGGTTDQHNAAMICGHHNRLKSQAVITVSRDEEGYWHSYREDGSEITDEA